MRAQSRPNLVERESGHLSASSSPIARPAYSSNAVHQMQWDVQVRLIDEGLSDTGSGRVASGAKGRVPRHALVTVPAVIVGAAVVTPVAIIGLGIGRLARGRFDGLGADTADTMRAVWRATTAAVDALTDSRSSGR